MHKIVKTIEELNNILYNPEFIVLDIRPFDEAGNVLLVIYRHVDDCSGVENFRTNVILASFIIMYGRIALWNLLFMVHSHKDCELLYFDTVSNNINIFFIF